MSSKREKGLERTLSGKKNTVVLTLTKASTRNIRQLLCLIWWWNWSPAIISPISFKFTFAGYNSVVLKDKVLQYVELIHIKNSSGRPVTNVIGFASLILTTFHDICLKMLLNFNLMWYWHVMFIISVTICFSC